MAPSFQRIPYRQSISLCARLGGDGGRVNEFLDFQSDFPAAPHSFASMPQQTDQPIKQPPERSSALNRPRRVL